MTCMEGFPVTSSCGTPQPRGADCKPVKEKGRFPACCTKLVCKSAMPAKGVATMQGQKSGPGSISALTGNVLDSGNQAPETQGRAARTKVSAEWKKQPAGRAMPQVATDPEFGTRIKMPEGGAKGSRNRKLKLV
ncbi:uncharacterized protein LOC144173310 [Haemaphysalis longicornis]